MTNEAEKPAERSGEDIQRVHELLEVMHEHDLDAITVTTAGTTYELVRREPGLAPVAPVQATGSASSAPSGETQQVPSPSVKRVTAPLTGVFYSASSPDTEPFVKIGERIETGEILCILEAMKLFNEIQSDYSGTIVRMVPENGELVSQGEELFWIEP